MQLNWLHISAFHLRAGDPYDRDLVLGALVRAVRRFRERGRAADLIFATGDVAHSGKSAEYQLATTFFDELLEAAGLERRDLFVIPGNHDVDREFGVGLARTLGSSEEADIYFRPGGPKIHLTQKLAQFAEWYNGYFDGIRVLSRDSTCGPVEIVEVSGGRVAVLPINTALFCQGDDDFEKLCVGRRSVGVAIEELGRSEVQLRVALLHHPLEWLRDFERTNVRTALRTSVDIILRGHLHETDVEQVVAPSGTAVHLAAGAAYQTRKWPNRALYATISGSSLRVCPIRYEDQPTEVWTVETSLFPTAPDYEGNFELRGLVPEPSAETLSDLNVSSLASSRRIWALDGHPVHAPADDGSSPVYTGGCHVSFTLAHSGGGKHSISLHAIELAVVRFEPGPRAEYEYHIEGAEIIGAGVVKPHVFLVSVCGDSVGRARWVVDPERGLAAPAMSANFLDTDEPRVLAFPAGAADVEELRGTILAQDQGFYELSIQFFYSVAGIDKFKASEPIFVYTDE